jgi:hypothetical protein
MKIKVTISNDNEDIHVSRDIGLVMADDQFDHPEFKKNMDELTLLISNQMSIDFTKVFKEFIAKLVKDK